MKNTKSYGDLNAAISVMGDNILAHFQNNRHSYRPIAVELRKLLCDKRGKKDHSLLFRIYDDIHFHPLKGNPNMLTEHTVLYIPAMIDLSGNCKGKLSHLFDEGKAPIPIAQWLEQRLFSKQSTIKDFIRSVSDKEAAHSDEDYNDILRKTKSVSLAGPNLTEATIVSIARYILRWLAIRTVNDNLQKISEFIKGKYENTGRGSAKVCLREFSRNFSKGVPLKYQNEELTLNHFTRDEKKRSVAKFLSDYDPSTWFLLLIQDLNDELWLYEQKMHLG